MQYTVSIVIPTYNRILMLEEALNSVFLQKFEGSIEIFVVDDCSEDKTSEVVSEKYPDVNLICLKQNSGVSVARNQALIQAKGQYIAFLDSDDLWKDNYLETQIKTLKGQERTISVSNLTIWDTIKNTKKTRKQQPNFKKYNSAIHNLLTGSSFIGTPSSVVFPKQVFEEVGLFQEGYRGIGSDSDLYLRCLIAGYRLVYNKQTEAIQRQHSFGQITSHPQSLAIRQKARLERLRTFYPLVKEKLSSIDERQLYTELYFYFTDQYLKRGMVLQWWNTICQSRKYTAYQIIIINILRDWKTNFLFSISKYFL